jgi:hypothetical protein
MSPVDVAAPMRSELTEAAPVIGLRGSSSATAR